MTNNKNKGINLIEYNYSNLITGLLFEETYKLVLKLEEYLKTYSLSLDPLEKTVKLTTQIRSKLTTSFGAN